VRFTGAFTTLAILTACSTTAAQRDAEAVHGDPIRGHTLVVSRDGGFCVLCHEVPGETLGGNLGPSLAHVGSRLSPGEIRARVADMSRIRPDAAMPSFHRTCCLERVAPERVGQPVLNDEQLDDVVSYLSTLK
jgi:sulfur-oxidizing protein SoxX